MKDHVFLCCHPVLFHTFCVLHQHMYHMWYILSIVDLDSRLVCMTHLFPWVSMETATYASERVAQRLSNDDYVWSLREQQTNRRTP